MDSMDLKRLNIFGVWRLTTYLWISIFTVHVPTLILLWSNLSFSFSFLSIKLLLLSTNQTAGFWSLFSLWVVVAFICSPFSSYIYYHNSLEFHTISWSYILYSYRLVSFYSCWYIHSPILYALFCRHVVKSLSLVPVVTFLLLVTAAITCLYACVGVLSSFLMPVWVWSHSGSPVSGSMEWSLTFYSVHICTFSVPPAFLFLPLYHYILLP